jgi:NDP-sugar pyrophosphorylase family protein
MILAAGGGTRLRPLTEKVPKALIEVGGRPMLSWVLERLAGAGAKRIVVNTHHHADQIQAHLEGPGGREGIEIVMSPEPEGPLDTGGGLFNAAPLFEGRRPILLHNVDVISEIDLSALLQHHREITSVPDSRVVASLAVQDRGSTRTLLFDGLGLLGWENRRCDHAREGRVQVREPEGEVRSFSFSGIHVLEPSIFTLSQRKGAFSIISLYLDLAREGWEIRPVDVTGQTWFDIGTPDKLERARAWANWAIS